MSGGTQDSLSLRKAVGALKDSTTVGLAKVNSGYKKLDIAIVGATNHAERLANEKHMKAIFAALSATRPRADVMYGIHALARRLSKTCNWVVALKTLIVIHRALREVDPTFYVEINNYRRSKKNHLLNLAHFKDDSSPNAWSYSIWIRTYALFLEEKLECFRVLKYDVEGECPKTKDLNTVELLEQLPALQQLLHRLLRCLPKGEEVHNFIIQSALSMVVSESIKIYTAITDGTVSLMDKFFEMQRHDAIRALDIYMTAGQQTEKLSEFYEICKNLDIGRGERFIKIEQMKPPASFIQAMEDYVTDAPRSSTAHQVVDDKNNASEVRPPSSPPPEPVKVEEPATEPPDLLELNDPIPDASDLDQKNSLALAIISDADQPEFATPTLANGATDWELALDSASSSNGNAPVSKLASGFDELTLERLYDDATRTNNQNTWYSTWETFPEAGPTTQEVETNPFLASNTAVAPLPMQMPAMANQQQAFAWQQQQMMISTTMNPQQQQPLNLFGSPYGASVPPYGSSTHVQANNPFRGFI